MTTEAPKTVGLIGSGLIGGTVARLAVAAGYDVVLSNSRGPETLAGLAGEIGARAVTAEEAAEADLVVVSVPFKAFRDLPVAQLAGKPVLDTNNYYPARDGQFAEIDDGSLTSSEVEQQHLGDARMVKVFNNIFWKSLQELARPAGAADRSALTIAGDDADAKQAATAFLDAIGYDTVDVGGLADSWRVQPGAPAYGAQYDGMQGPATPAGVDVVEAAVRAATR